MAPPAEAIVGDRRYDRVSALANAAAHRADIRLSVYDDLSAVEQDWRVFEQHADCIVFQSFDWLAAWHRHIGKRNNVRAAIVLGRDPEGQILFLAPFAIEPGHIRRLTWLGSDLCDYNAPLLAANFQRRIAPGEFAALWQDIRKLLQSHPRLRHDIIELEKMPEAIGGQPNPFLQLDVGLNPDGAHTAHLSGNWDEFYTAKRSSATRRRDRAKLRRLGEYGEVRFVNTENVGDVKRTFEVLVLQKKTAFARMGVADLFARPGYREFFLDLATNPTTRHLVHVSRLDVGPTWAAVSFGLTFRGCYYYVLASYHDGELSRFGPGAAHLREVLRHAIGLGLKKFDFTIGDERYKLEWSDSAVKLYDYMAAATPRGWPRLMRAAAQRWLKRTIKQTPILWRVFRGVRASVGSFFVHCGTKMQSRWDKNRLCL